PERLFHNKTKISEFIIDETQIKVGSEYIWLWVAIESETTHILGISISKEQNMFVAHKRFLFNVVKDYGEHPVSTDGCTWYPQSCKFLKINHHLHSSLKKNIIERKFSILKTEQNVLMTIFHVKKEV
ncbi:MAG TPA: DDE-type integrase/transposase/recombinase, partial [Verrucomicrobiae bacterium]|nr:DDE-type integrase/transposase/recombinase [Verrucomicrobiae bacterium]